MFGLRKFVAAALLAAIALSACSSGSTSSPDGSTNALDATTVVPTTATVTSTTEAQLSTADEPLVECDTKVFRAAFNQGRTRDVSVAIYSGRPAKASLLFATSDHQKSARHRALHPRADSVA